MGARESLVFNIDCMIGMKQFTDNYFDLAVTDPPYGINVNMNAGRKIDTKSKKRSVKKWDNKTPTKEYFTELKRISKNQIIFGGNYFTEFLHKSSGWIFWDKCVAEGCSFSDGELAWTSFNQSLKKAVIPWSGFIGMEGEKFHPTTKPIALYKWIYNKYLFTGGKVIDTHLGSASNRIAAYNHGNIDFYGYEIDPDYFRYGKERFDNHVLKCEEIKQLGYAKTEISKHHATLF